MCTIGIISQQIKESLCATSPLLLRPEIPYIQEAKKSGNRTKVLGGIKLIILYGDGRAIPVRLFHYSISIETLT